MEPHFELSDQEFVRQFANGQMDPAVFSHEAHLRLAWIHVRKYGVSRAIENICAQLKNFVARHGAAAKYNETVTVAAVKAVHYFHQQSSDTTFYSFIQTFPRLKHNFREIMGRHYSINIFTSEAAKKTYMEPDLCAFPA